MTLLGTLGVYLFFFLSNLCISSDISRKIIYTPAPILRKTTTEISHNDQETIQTLIEMADFIDDSLPQKSGIALPQVGISKRGFVALVDDDPVIMINPVVTLLGKKAISFEGCLSIPNTYGNVYRNEEVLVHYRDEDWNKQILQLDDQEAFIVQHENDHLTGILFTDKLIPGKIERSNNRLD